MAEPLAYLPFPSTDWVAPHIISFLPFQGGILVFHRSLVVCLMLAWIIESSPPHGRHRVRRIEIFSPLPVLFVLVLWVQVNVVEEFIVGTAQSIC